jgi:hypothetical protein
MTSSAPAQSSSDPAPTSPSGRTYSLPLDTGRRDAAPGSSGGSPSFRSDNGFGSSSTVPGDPTTSDEGKGKSKGNQQGNEGALNEGAQSAQSTDSGNSSEPVNFALLGLIGAIGAGVGIAASKARGRIGGH